MGVFAEIVLVVVGEVEVVLDSRTSEGKPSTGLKEMEVSRAYERCASSVKVVF